MPKRRRKKKGKKCIFLGNCKIESMRVFLRSVIAQNKSSLKEVLDADSADLVWTGAKYPMTLFDDHKSGKPRRFLINRLPMIGVMCKKANLSRMLKMFEGLLPRDFDFIPQTWIMPQDYRNFKASFTKRKTYILKPSNSARGEGIRIARKWNTIDKIIKGNPNEDYVVQRYIASPMLLDGYKFDYRIYVVVFTQDADIKYIIFNDGLTRFGTKKYKRPNKKNIYEVYMHITNYSLNKKSEQFKDIASVEEESASKRKISTTLRQLRRKGKNVQSHWFWDEVDEIVSKTLSALCLPIYPHVFLNSEKTGPDDIHGNAFHILGFDIMMDSKKKLWLLEVNGNPALSPGEWLDAKNRIDAKIKSGIIVTVLKWFSIMDGEVQPSGPVSSEEDDEDESCKEDQVEDCESKSVAESFDLWSDFCLAIKQGDIKEVAQLLELATSPKLNNKDAEPRIETAKASEMIIGLAKAFRSHGANLKKDELVELNEDKRENGEDTVAISGNDSPNELTNSQQKLLEGQEDASALTEKIPVNERENEPRSSRPKVAAIQTTDEIPLPINDQGGLIASEGGGVDDKQPVFWDTKIPSDTSSALVKREWEDYGVFQKAKGEKSNSEKDLPGKTINPTGDLEVTATACPLVDAELEKENKDKGEEESLEEIFPLTSLAFDAGEMMVTIFESNFLKQVFLKYCPLTRFPPSHVGMLSVKFSRFCADANLVCEQFLRADADLLFRKLVSRVEYPPRRHMGYDLFCEAVVIIAQRLHDQSTPLLALKAVLNDISRVITFDEESRLSEKRPKARSYKELHDGQH